MLRYEYPSAQSSRLALTTHGLGRHGSTAMLNRSLSTGHYAQLAASLLLDCLFYTPFACNFEYLARNKMEMQIDARCCL